MLYRIAVLWEVFSIIICIHEIYNRRIKLDIKTVGLVLVTVGILEMIRQLNLNNAVSLWTSVLMVLYCTYKFKDNILGAIISTLLMLILIAILQFVFVLALIRAGVQDEVCRMLLINIIVSIFNLLLLPKLKIYKLRAIIRRHDKSIFFTFFAILFVVSLIMIRVKLQGEINASFYVFAVPLLIVLLWTLRKWGIALDEKESVQKELLITKSMQEEYDDLLTSVKMREHGFKNHLAALLSIKYTSKSYEELVKGQDRYYGVIREGNRYNKLLFLGDSTIVGFLYEKFYQAEDEGIAVTYEINGCFSGSLMPIYQIIEILGILFDNAIEAQLGEKEVKRLRFQFEEQDATFLFRIWNPYPYVNYAEIESWFLQNNSKKGKNRGIGLYYAKKLCEEHGGNILCRNVEREQENWIEITLEIEKADKS